MITLAIDTATQTLSVALVSDKNILEVLSEPAAQTQDERLPELVAELFSTTGLMRDQVSHIALGVGPGAYTGLRVGLMFGLTFARAVGAKPIGICSHDAIVPEDFNGLVVTDARRKEVYLSGYASGKRISGPLVVKPSEIVQANQQIIGDGVAKYPEIFKKGNLIQINAGILGQKVNQALLAGATVSEELPKLSAASTDGSGSLSKNVGLLLPPIPLYLRRPDVAEPK